MANARSIDATERVSRKASGSRSTAEERLGGVAKPIQLIGYQDVPTFQTNWFSVSVTGPDELRLVVGQADPPILLGETDDERRREVEEIKAIPTRVLFKGSMTMQRAAALAQVLTQVVARYTERAE